MTGFSNPERRGLQQMQADAGVHPDADLLTAFSEQTLTSRERQQVLAHLASCIPCREIVALAVPPMVEAAPQPVPRLAAWKWPVLRWGAVAVTTALVLVVVSVNRVQRKAEPVQSMIGSKTEATTPIPMSEAPATAELARQNTETQVAAKGAVAGVKKPQVRYEKVAPSGRDELAAARADKRGAPEESFQMADRAASVIAPPPPSPRGRPETARVGGANANIGYPESQRFERKTDFPLTAAQVKEAPVLAQNESTSSAQSKDTQLRESDAAGAANSDFRYQAKAELEAAPMAVAPAAPGRAAQTLSKARRTRLAAPTDWHVTSDGSLQRSFDRGQTWDHALAGQKFRAVAFIRNSVWAGGAQGLLLHSTDGGETWARITPASNDINLTGDITAIRFTEVEIGSVATSNGETWTTTDGGNTWKKQ